MISDAFDGQEEEINLLQGLDLNVLDQANTDELLVVRGKRFLKILCLCGVFFTVDFPVSTLFSLPAAVSSCVSV